MIFTEIQFEVKINKPRFFSDFFIFYALLTKLLTVRIFSELQFHHHSFITIYHKFTAESYSMQETRVIALAASEPEANERGSSLISRRLHYRGLQSLFLAKRKGLWHAQVKDLGCAGVCGKKFRMPVVSRKE